MGEDERDIAGATDDCSREKRSAEDADARAVQSRDNGEGHGRKQKTCARTHTHRTAVVPKLPRHVMFMLGLL